MIAEPISVSTSVLFDYSFWYKYLKQKKKQQILSCAETDKPEQNSNCRITPSGQVQRGGTHRRKI